MASICHDCFGKCHMDGRRLLVPSREDQEIVHRMIYDELVLGQINPASREAYLKIMRCLTGRGAEGIIFGCTEIGLLFNDEVSPVPTFDTTHIHAKAAVKYALVASSASEELSLLG